MVNNLLANHGIVIFPGLLFLLILWGLISSRKKARKERPDPPVVFAPIRGMFVCYQCDTIFNTPRCPECNEEAVVPLIQLTGNIIGDERVAAVIGKLQRRSDWKLPIFQPLEDGLAIVPKAASRKKAPNGGASEVPLPIAVHESERGRELS